MLAYTFPHATWSLVLPEGSLSTFQRGSPTSLLANSYDMSQKLSLLLCPLNIFTSFENKFLIATSSKSPLEKGAMGVEGFYFCLHSL